LFTVRAEEKGLRLLLELAPDLPPWSHGDPARLRQVVHNLLANAIKFTHSGSVTLRAALAGEGIRIAVEDTGIGIPPGQVESIFKPFEQADSSITRRYGGTGLGLSIAAKLVNAMGGSISVTSRFGAGSCFEFTIPLPAVPPPPEAAERTPDLSPPRALRILIAEDNKVNLTVVRRILEYHRHTVLTAPNGRVAIEIWRAELPDLILMDIQMPEMDGLSASLAIRGEEGGRAHVPIIALTAHALEGYSQQTTAAGMDAYLTKPIRESELLAAIYQLLAAPAS
jgi:CheY-like chemotaxis protein/anti-sigma regulatory factor (Ser/Thr protein kinase)